MNTTTPISSQLLKPLDDLHALSLQLFHSLSPPNARPPPPPSIESFLECDVQIAAALKVARVHQIKQQRIEELKDEILDLEQQLAEIFGELEKGRLDLEDILDEADVRTKSIQAARECQFGALQPNPISKFCC